MVTTKQRGRPRCFDPDQALATAQSLFHARGFDAVGVAEITSTLGISAPSFYAAFGNKAGLYARVLQRWSQTGAIPLEAILAEERPPAEALTLLLEDAAQRYAAHPETPGCLVLAGTHCIDADARSCALAMNQQAEALVLNFIARTHPGQAEVLADFVSTTLSGLSAKARNGHSAQRLLASAQLAAATVRQILAGHVADTR